ncbi:MAG: PKD domain-containing protein, partial [Gammaproteobacteria bacterium]|nr:PKD domain-containing protein [Gammaproteobacteria bacterium]
SPASLTFTADNWNVAQTVTVTGIDDSPPAADGNIAYTVVTAAAVSMDNKYSGLNPADVSLTNKDNDVPGFAISPVSGLITTESGGKATFTVALDTRPSAGITLPLSSSEPGKGTVSPASLTFTADNWNVAQTVTVTGIDDSPPAADGDIAYTVVTAAAISEDDDYNELNPDDVLVTNEDNDGGALGFAISPVSGLITTESGGKASFTVTLDTRPSASVTLPLSSSKPGEGTVSPASLTFTAGNWNIAQTVTVTGVNDNMDDGDMVYTIVTGNPNSDDSNYNRAVNPADVSVTNLQPPIANFTVTPGSAPLAVDLDASASHDTGGAVVGYEWSSSDGQTASGRQVSMSFPAEGSYEIDLTVEDNDGLFCMEPAQQTVVVKPRKSCPRAQPSWQWAVQRNASDWDRVDMVLDNSGHINVTGSLSCQSNQRSIAQYDHSGSLQWDKMLTSPCWEGGTLSPNSIAANSIGDIFMAGNENGTIEYNYDAAGDTVSNPWTHIITGSWIALHDAAIDSVSNNVHITGFFRGTIQLGDISLSPSGSLNSAFFIAKYDSLGNVLWAQKADGDFRRTSGSDGKGPDSSIAVDNSGNSYVTGSFMKGTAIFDSSHILTASTRYDAVFIVKYDDSGNVAWAEKIENSHWLRGNDIVIDNDIAANAAGNVYVTGNMDYDDMFIAKYNANTGDGSLWPNHIGGHPDKQANAMAIDDCGDIYVTGSIDRGYTAHKSTREPPHSYDIFVDKYDASGNLAWTRETALSSYGIGNGGMGTDIAVSACDDVYVTGILIGGTTNFGNCTDCSLSGSGAFVAKIAQKCPSCVQPPSNAGGDDKCKQSGPVEISFLDTRNFYYVNNTVSIRASETQTGESRSEPVDLWVAVRVPDGGILFKSPASVFSPEPQAFKTGIAPSETEHPALESAFAEKGEYTLYALYVREGADPVSENLLDIQRSNLASFTFNLSGLAEINFDGMQDSYEAGETVRITVAETQPLQRPERTDLWAAVQVPAGGVLFRASSSSTPFSPEPQAFKTGVEPSNTVHPVIEFKLPPGVEGVYTFYALYVQEGSNPLSKNNRAVQRSNVAVSSVVFRDVSVSEKWTDWLDRDNPGGTGDWEDLNGFGASVCSNPMAVQARRKSDQLDADLTGEIFHRYDLISGFACRNGDQPDNACFDYEVRFMCP